MGDTKMIKSHSSKCFGVYCIRRHIWNSIKKSGLTYAAALRPWRWLQLVDLYCALASPHCGTFYASQDFNPPLPAVAIALTMAAKDHNPDLHRKCLSVARP